ncbi:hypothetical protein BUALT_Bualt01G0149900 [Buddleja alternifolia]|uniref:BAH domain-containing protein n=1 Tax=Buddleja alternifolia TaxID=168488 RepID=A0AAV6YHP9_9LAMI|nr:hypothetical protein BUALT_Bualt01G0149900 [Buddleja alternifolia]
MRSSFKYYMEIHAMLQEPKGDEDLQFCWGQKKGTANLYESFTLDGIEYSLYDCVYMWRTDQAEPDIGKLVRIWETDGHERKVEVVWFFRPTEIAHWLGDIKPLQKEIFLACGQGKDLSNVDPLEAISGKCNVVCSSKHTRNSQPTEEEMRKVDYIFYRTFDVGKYIISEKFPSSIGGIEVHHFFNRREYVKRVVCALPKANSKPSPRTEETLARATKDGQSRRVEKGFKVPAAPMGRQINNLPEDGIHSGAKRKSFDSGAKVKSSERFLSARPSDIGAVNKRKLLDSLGMFFVHPFKLEIHLGLFDSKITLALAEGCREEARPHSQSRVSGHEKHMNVEDSCKEKKELSTRVNLEEKASKLIERGGGSKHHVSPTISYKYMEVTRRPEMDSSKWFKPKPWVEERLFEAHDKGTLVLLENLDPSFTSSEVEDIVWHAFGQKVNAKMIQRSSFSSPHSGQAFAIFKTKEAADNVISRLTNGCLMLGDGRPIVGRREAPIESGHSSGFVGHLSIDRTRSHRQREAMKNAVSTSHYSQSNTIEYELAIEWRLLQEKSDLWWRALYEEQGKEIKVLLKQMKSHHHDGRGGGSQWSKDDDGGGENLGSDGAARRLVGPFGRMAK